MLPAWLYSLCLHKASKATFTSLWNTTSPWGLRENKAKPVQLELLIVMILACCTLHGMVQPKEFN